MVTTINRMERILGEDLNNMTTRSESRDQSFRLEKPKIIISMMDES